MISIVAFITAVLSVFSDEDEESGGEEEFEDVDMSEIRYLAINPGLHTLENCSDLMKLGHDVIPHSYVNLNLSLTTHHLFHKVYVTH